MKPDQVDWNAIVAALVVEIAREVGKEVRVALAERSAQDAVEIGARPQREPKAAKRMNIRQAAEYVGIPYGTFRQWRQHHRIPIPAIKVSSRKVLYDRDDLDRWMASMKERRPDG